MIRNSDKIIGKLIVVSGPSGAGKTTICKELCRTIPNVEWSVSVTTRPQREGELDGQDYYFIDEKEFCQKIQCQEFLEYARVHDHYYGTLHQNVADSLRCGHNYLVEIDVQGARQIKDNNLYPAIFIFIKPPDLQTLQQRLIDRNRDQPDVIAQRLHNAQKEMAVADFYQYYIENTSLVHAIATIKKILQRELA